MNADDKKMFCFVFVAGEDITTQVMPTVSPSSKIHWHTLHRFWGTKLFEPGFPIFRGRFF